MHADVLFLMECNGSIDKDSKIISKWIYYLNHQGEWPLVVKWGIEHEGSGQSNNTKRPA